MTEVVLKSGETATKIEGLPYQWLVRLNQHTFWVVEPNSGDDGIADVDLNDMSRLAGWGVAATATKRFKYELEGSEMAPGWWVAVGQNYADVPYRTIPEAVEAMLAELRQNHAARIARAAKEA